MFQEVMPIWIGLWGGLCIGLTGIGAGSVINTLILLIFGNLYPTIILVGTSAVHGTFLKTFISWREYFRASLQRSQVGWMILGALPATIFGSVFLCTWLSNLHVLRGVLYGTLLLISLVILGDTYWNASKQISAEEPQRSRSKIALVVSGLILGLIVGTTSSGSGTLLIPTLLFFLRFTAAQAVPLALWAGSLILMVAALSHIAQGHVNWWLLWSLLLGSLPGIVIGQLFRQRMPERLLRVCIALVIMSLMSWKLYNDAQWDAQGAPMKATTPTERSTVSKCNVLTQNRRG